ncbi:hypothetical protein ACQCWA_20895 [Rossellomorea aquimaris]|uniref:hypothetical protein n=1 Tax=Rossellomorea aquimaris TaxID=189382 RepID=UPI003CFB928C
MKKIQQLKELLALKQELREDLMQYLEEEFYGLYEYLSNGEQVDEFVLETQQAMILLEEKGELNILLSNPLELEFQEEVNLKNSRVLRIGVLSAEDIQLCYVLK